LDIIYQMAGNKSSAARAKPQKPEPSFQRWFFGHVFSLLRRHGNAITIWAGLGYFAHELSLALIHFAGRSSTADLTLKLMANISFVWTASITMTGLSITLYLRERTLHRKTRERLAARVTELELKVDPSRTSSLLTSKGLTRKGDE
jgi:hypothetical protein